MPFTFFGQSFKVEPYHTSHICHTIGIVLQKLLTSFAIHVSASSYIYLCLLGEFNAIADSIEITYPHMTRKFHIAHVFHNWNFFF